MAEQLTPIAADAQRLLPEIRAAEKAYDDARRKLKNESTRRNPDPVEIDRLNRAAKTEDENVQRLRAEHDQILIAIEDRRRRAPRRDSIALNRF